MSFSLKREIEFYINDVDSTDGVQKLAILPEFQLELSAELIQVYRKIIGEDPEMLPRGAVDQISPISLGFITYLKPSLLDGKYGITAPEKILYDSLGGALGYRGADYYKAQFGRVNRLLPLYIFLKTTTAVYKINLAYIDSLEISYDINYLLVGKWTAKAISLDIYDINDITFTNIKDYTGIDSYIRNKFTTTIIYDYDTNKEYKFPITNSTIKIINSLMPTYDKNIKVVTGKPKDLIITGRAVSGELFAYLSSRIDHSKEFLEDLLNNLDRVNRKFKISYLTSDGKKSVEIILPFAQLNIPNLDFQDVLNTKLEFSSSESVYGLNNDISLKYLIDTSGNLNYADYVKYSLNPEYWYRLNETQNTTLYNLGSKGATFNLTRTAGTVTINQPGPYLNSKGWALNSAVIGNSSTKDPLDEIVHSFWYKPQTVNANEWLYAYISDVLNVNYYLRVDRSSSLSGGGYRGIYVHTVGGSYAFDLSTTGTWNHFVIYTKSTTSKLIVYHNNVKKIDTTATFASITGEAVTIGVGGGNGISNSVFSELIISTKVTAAMLPDFVSTLYNITDTNNTVSVGSISVTDYNDTLLSYKGLSDDYIKAIKTFNPKAYWRFNDYDSTKVRDHITGNYPLTISYNPKLRIEGPLQNDNTSKGIWFSRLGDGTLQYTTSSSPISTTNITKNTYIFWIYIDDDNLLDNNYRQCLLKTGSNNGNVFALLHRIGSYGSFYANGIIYYNYDVGYNDGYYDCTYGFGVYIPIPLQKWTCIALACNRINNTIKMYRDGNYINTITNGNVNTWWPSTIALEIGKRTYANSYRSTFKISEFAYFENELSDISIRGIYASSGITGFNFVIPTGSTNNTLNIRSYIPKVTVGNIVKPINSTLNIHQYSTKVKGIVVLNATRGSNIIFEVWDPDIEQYENVPIIKFYVGKYPSKGSININGNMPICGIYKKVLPSKGIISISGSISTNTRYYKPYNSRIVIISSLVNVVQYYNIQPISFSMSITGNAPDITQISSGAEVIYTTIFVNT